MRRCEKYETVRNILLQLFDYDMCDGDEPQTHLVKKRQFIHKLSTASRRVLIS